MDFRNCQTTTASPAEPGGLPITLGLDTRLSGPSPSHWPLGLAHSTGHPDAAAGTLPLGSRLWYARVWRPSRLAKDRSRPYTDMGEDTVSKEVLSFADALLRHKTNGRRMSEHNIELFNHFVADLLSLLYRGFPKEINIELESFDYLNTQEDADVFYSTVRFLEHEGFIRYSNQTYGGFVMVSLTAKGLAALNEIPDSIEKKEPMSARINSALQSGSAEVIKSAIVELFKLSVSSLIR